MGKRPCWGRSTLRIKEGVHFWWIREGRTSEDVSQIQNAFQIHQIYMSKCQANPDLVILVLIIAIRAGRESRGNIYL